MRRASILVVAALALAGCAASGNVRNDAAPQAGADVPFSGHIRHVFVLVLENEDYASTFGSSPEAPYLGKTLPSQGRLLTQYYGIGHSSLDNYVAMISGQAPNPATQDDCVVYADFHEVTQLDGQAVGQGCVYPTDVLDLGTQLARAGRSWRMYAEDMAASPGSAPTSCRHPDINARDPWIGASGPNDQYATKHVPFVYFHNVIDDKASCDKHVVDLKLLGDDLNASTVPDLAFLSPNLCSDGHDSPCVNGEPGGYASMDKFLQSWIPRITSSATFRADGLLVVTFDESGSDATACCNEQPGPNSPAPGIQGQGGGRIGAILLSPCYAGGATDDTPHNHYALLRTLEDVWKLPHVGYAAQQGLTSIDLSPCA